MGDLELDHVSLQLSQVQDIRLSRKPRGEERRHADGALGGGNHDPEAHGPKVSDAGASEDRGRKVAPVREGLPGGGVQLLEAAVELQARQHV